MIGTWKTGALGAGAFACLGAFIVSAPAEAHPHIFAEARLEVSIGADGVVELRHVWRFDPYFSSTVMLEFDANTNLELEEAELVKIGETVKQSLADFSYYTSILKDGADQTVQAPEQIYANFEDGQLLLFFAVKPEEPMPLDGTLSFGVYDPTMYASLDFVNDSDLVVLGEAEGCASSVVRPDPDKIIAENQGSLTDAFFNDPEGYDVTKLFATRLELAC